jgi:hypothetical protein
LAAFQIEVDEDMMTNGQLAKNSEMDRAQLEIELDAETILDDSSTAHSDMVVENIMLGPIETEVTTPSEIIDSVQRIGNEN